MNVQQYTHEVIDEIVKIANLDSLVRHKLIRRIHNLKSYKEFKYKNLTIKKPEGPRKKTPVIPFHSLPVKVQKIMLLACEKYET